MATSDWNATRSCHPQWQLTKRVGEWQDHVRKPHTGCYGKLDCLLILTTPFQCSSQHIPNLKKVKQANTKLSVFLSQLTQLYQSQAHLHLSQTARIWQLLFSEVASSPSAPFLLWHSSPSGHPRMSRDLFPKWHMWESEHLKPHPFSVFSFWFGLRQWLWIMLVHVADSTLIQLSVPCLACGVILG